jgi:hypothetical protein
MQEGQTDEVMARLAELFPKELPTSTGTRADTWDQTTLNGARRRHILSHLKAGWKWVNGFLDNGKKGKEHIEKRVPEYVTVPSPGMPGYNPHIHAPAVREGGILIQSGKWAGYYQGPSGVMDRHGSLIDNTECPICHGLRFHVRQEWRAPYPNPRPWEAHFGPCPKCVTPQERAANEARVLASAPQPRRR